MPKTRGFDEKTAQRKRLERWALQSAARELLPEEKVALCMRQIAPLKSTVDIVYSEKVKRASYKNLLVCARVWIDPICSSKITERRRVEMTKAVDDNPELLLVLVTFTLCHKAGDNLKSLLGDLLNSFRRLKSGKRWQGFIAAYVLLGSIRALETTYGENGWHPHLHVLFFFKRTKDFDEKAVTEFLKERWRGVLAKNSRTATYENGVDVRTADRDIAEYVAKFGHEPVDMKRPGSWTIEAELTKAPAKLARGAAGRSPMQLLADYMAGDKKAGKLFQEYAAAFKGRNQLVWSRGLRKLLGMGREETDEEIAEREDTPARLLARLTLSEWKIVLAKDLRGEVLEIASSGDVSKVRDYLLSMGIDNEYIRWCAGQYEGLEFAG